MGKVKLIAVAGHMATGKSTLIRLLHQKWGVTPLYETNEENPFLSLFYQDMYKWSFHSQLYFLIKKIELYREVQNLKGVIALDRTIYEDAEIFATALHEDGKMNASDFNLYWDVYETLSNFIQPPDLMIYLKCSVDELQRRLIIRNRTIERSISKSYLEDLQKRYEKWINQYHASKVLIIDTEKTKDLTEIMHTVFESGEWK